MLFSSPANDYVETRMTVESLCHMGGRLCVHQPVTESEAG